MRVVYLNPSGRMGGAEVALLDMLASIRHDQPEWKLHLIVSDDGIVAAKARALGVFTTILPFPASLARLGDASVGERPAIVKAGYVFSYCPQVSESQFTSRDCERC